MCKLMVVTSRKLCQGDFFERIHLLCRAGVDEIVLREKDLSEWEYQKLAKEVLEVCQEYQTKCILHHYVYSAIALRADGIHVSVPVAMKHNRMIQEARLVGVSTHSLEQIYLADACHADYVFYGHVFETDCKLGLMPRGIRALEEVCEKSALPVYAIGGILPENAESCLNAGAAGVCVMSWGMKASEAEVAALAKKCHEYRRFPSELTKELALK